MTYPVTPPSYTALMERHGSNDSSNEWVAFPGGELEGHPPKAMCPACREALSSASKGSAIAPKTLCFQCYRAELTRVRSLRAAATLDTASEARFQAQLPFEPVDRPRLQMLKAQRLRARVIGHRTFAERRHQAQMAARRAVQAAAATAGPIKPVKAGRLPVASTGIDRLAAIAAAIHAAELQLPESWLPFVVAR
jgi:hypothetical protein